MSTFQPLVSVIVPCYQQAHFLDQSLRSVLDQTYQNWECIIVNDGSSDETDSIALHWTAKDERFKYLEQENKGLSGARNAGIKICEGEYILPLDADDILDKDYLKTIVPEILKQPEAAVISCYTKFFHGNTNTIVGELTPTSGTVKSLLYENQLVATSLFRKTSWKQIGGYDERMKNGFEDWEFWISIVKLNKNYIVIPKHLFFYRKAKKSMLVNTIKNHFEDNKEYIIKKHKELYIKDFDNFVSVMFYNIRTHRASEIRLKNNKILKFLRILFKPIAILRNSLKQ
jgi:glycosyltransferase involved in cell wall biosynthesis